MARVPSEAAEQGFNQFATAAPGQWGEVDAFVAVRAAAPQWPTLVQWGSGEAQHHQGQVVAGVRDVIDEVEGAVIGPVQVVEQQDDGRAIVLVEQTEILRRGVERAVADLLGVAGDT